MRNRAKSAAWSLLGTGTALLAGVLTRRVVRAGWEKSRGDAPPEDPAAESDGWKRALAWGVVSGAAVGVARVLGRSSAARGWRRLAGGEEPA